MPCEKYKKGRLIFGRKRILYLKEREDRCGIGEKKRKKDFVTRQGSKVHGAQRRPNFTGP